jgi:hypothetical protein
LYKPELKLDSVRGQRHQALSSCVLHSVTTDVFASGHESVPGTKRTYQDACRFVRFWREADVLTTPSNVRFRGQSGH